MNTGVSVNGLRLAKGLLATRLHELEHGDLNGDSDSADDVLHESALP